MQEKNNIPEKITGKQASLEILKLTSPFILLVVLYFLFFS